MHLCIDFCHELRMVKFSKACFIPFDFRKGKTGNLVVPAQGKNQFLDQFTQDQEQKSFMFLYCGL